MKHICKKIRRAIPDFPDCVYPWDVLRKMQSVSKIDLPERHVSGLSNAEVYASPDVDIQPYCLFSGLVILDEGVRIGPYSFLRGPIYVGRNSLIGPHSEIIRCVFMDNVSIAHKNLIGDSLFDDDVNFGGMSMCCNVPVGRNFVVRRYSGEEFHCEDKYGAFIGSRSTLGTLTILMPGCYISENSSITGQCIVSGNNRIKKFTGDIPDRSVYE